MTESTENVSDDDLNVADPLSKIQRGAAGLVGFAGLAGGGVAVFKASNDAGSVALLGVGAIFFTVAINGMPILGAKFKDYEIRMAARKKALERIRSESPEDARHTLEVLNEIDPPSRNDPAIALVSVMLYEQEVKTAVMRALAADLGSNVTIREGGGDDGVDLLISSREQSIEVIVKYSRAPDVTRLSTVSLKPIYLQLANIYSKVMVITNMGISNQIAELAAVHDPGGDRAQVVRWRGREDDLALVLALRRLGFDRAGISPPGASGA